MGLNCEQRAQRILLRKLGLVKEDEAPSAEAIDAYRKLFEVPLCGGMIAAIADLFGWTNSTIQGTPLPQFGSMGGRLVEA